MVPGGGEPMLDPEGGAISASEKDAARKAYDHAREVYQQRIAESQVDFEVVPSRDRKGAPNQQCCLQKLLHLTVRRCDSWAAERVSFRIVNTQPTNAVPQLAQLGELPRVENWITASRAPCRNQGAGQSVECAHICVGKTAAPDNDTRQLRFPGGSGASATEAPSEYPSSTVRLARLCVCTWMNVSASRTPAPKRHSV